MVDFVVRLKCYCLHLIAKQWQDFFIKACVKSTTTLDASKHFECVLYTPTFNEKVYRTHRTMWICWTYYVLMVNISWKRANLGKSERTQQRNKLRPIPKEKKPKPFDKQKNIKSYYNSIMLWSKHDARKLFIRLHKMMPQWIGLRFLDILRSIFRYNKIGNSTTHYLLFLFFLVFGWNICIKSHMACSL